MIQRIQSVYLLLSAVFSGLCFCMDFVKWQSAIGQMGISAYRVGEISGGNIEGHPWGIMVFTALSLVLSMWAIFVFGHRKKQMKMAKAVIWMVLLNYVSIGAYTHAYFTRLAGEASLDICPAISFPLLTAIFAFLAYRGIRRDDELVRSADRIR